jgi:hypothetical protein
MLIFYIPLKYNLPCHQDIYKVFEKQTLKIIKCWKINFMVQSSSEESDSPYVLNNSQHLSSLL